ncbi:MAG: hypothetical protein I8H75_05845 [Myxococcaceae bacterium]|nr:hypothetical protein [Myxococcaceae bacterium]
MSRVELIWEHIQTISHSQNRLAIRQPSLAEHFGCSLKVLKELDRLQDTSKHEDRVKVYELPCPRPLAALRNYTCFEFEKATFTSPLLRIEPGQRLNPHAEQQWRLYHRTIKISSDC